MCTVLPGMDDTRPGDRSYDRGAYHWQALDMASAARYNAIAALPIRGGIAEVLLAFAPRRARLFCWRREDEFRAHAAPDGALARDRRDIALLHRNHCPGGCVDDRQPAHLVAGAIECLCDRAVPAAGPADTGGPRRPIAVDVGRRRAGAGDLSGSVRRAVSAARGPAVGRRAAARDDVQPAVHERARRRYHRGNPHSERRRDWAAGVLRAGRGGHPEGAERGVPVPAARSREPVRARADQPLPVSDGRPIRQYSWPARDDPHRRSERDDYQPAPVGALYRSAQVATALVAAACHGVRFQRADAPAWAAGARGRSDQRAADRDW